VDILPSEQKVWYTRNCGKRDRMKSTKQNGKANRPKTVNLNWGTGPSFSLHTIQYLIGDTLVTFSEQTQC
jgi:hypothetical protein